MTKQKFLNVLSFFAVGAIIVFGFSNIFASPQPNLLVNPGFENGGSAWINAVKSPNKSVVTTQFHSGAKSQQTIVVATNGQLTYQDMNVTVGSDYDVSGWVKTSAVDTSSPRIRITWLNATNLPNPAPTQNILRTDIVGGPAVGTQPWTLFSARLNAPVGTVVARFGLFSAIETDGSGTVWFDDNSFSLYLPQTIDTTPPTVAITQPVNNYTVAKTVNFNADATDNVAVEGVQFQLDGQNIGNEVILAPYTIAVDTTTFIDGLHQLTALARDTSNNNSTSTITIKINNNNRPNIVFFLTDDQRSDTMQYFPKLDQLFGIETAKFSNSFTATPLCCPNRATLLTGLYAHNHGVKGNSPPEGGFPAFQDFSTLATWLKNSGYQTSMVGKYLNAYGFVTNSQTYIPPGWDDWHAIVKGSPQYGFYYDYQLNENGTVNQYGSTPADYSTTVFANKAEAFINATSTTQPFFILVAPHGPHSPFLPEPSDIGSLAGIPPARPPSFNEADVSDKPQWVKNLVLFTPTEIAQIDLDRQAYLEMLSSEDRAIQQIYNALQNKGVLNNTIFIFTSDNGYSWGEHRWFENKNCVYDECIRVPLWVRIPGQTPKTINNLISSIDLAPTISEMAGIIPPNLVNGKSFVPLMENISTPWRSEILLESFGHGSKYPTLTNLRSFSAIREDQYKYVEYINGDKEFYDLAVDSYELNNSINNPAYSSIINNLKAKLTNLKAQ